MIGIRPFNSEAKAPITSVDPFRQRSAGQAACFFMPRIGLYPDAGKSRIRSNKTIQSLIQKNAAELRNMLICHIRSHFHKNGHMATRFRSQVGLLRFQGSQQTAAGSAA